MQLFEEQQLIKACAEGDLEKFGALYDLYFEKIYRYIYFKTYHRPTAEDLTSQTFFKALQAIKAFNPERGLFSSWLYKIAKNTVTDHFRTFKKESNIEDAFDLKGNENVHHDAEMKERLEKIMGAINNLKKEQREIIMMRIWDELSYREIAEILGKSEASCKMGFLRAMGKLRNEELLALAAIFALVWIAF